MHKVTEARLEEQDLTCVSGPPTLALLEVYVHHVSDPVTLVDCINQVESSRGRSQHFALICLVTVSLSPIQRLQDVVQTECDASLHVLLPWIAPPPCFSTSVYMWLLDCHH